MKLNSIKLTEKNCILKYELSSNEKYHIINDIFVAAFEFNEKKYFFKVSEIEEITTKCFMTLVGIDKNLVKYKIENFHKILIMKATSTQKKKYYDYLE